MSLFRREDLHSLAAPYALDALEPDERRRFEKHLERCDRCPAEVRALSEDAVRLAWSTAAPPRRRCVTASSPPCATHPRTTSPGAPSRRGPSICRGMWGTEPPPKSRARAPRMRSLLAPLATVTAAAALVVASLFAVQAERTQDQLAAERAQASEIAHVLAAPDARATSDRDAEGHAIGVIASAEEGSAIVTLSGFEDLPKSRVHQLWLMRPDVQPRSLGLFDGDTPLVADGMNTDATSLAVTVEPDGGSAQPTSQPVVQLALESVGFGE